MSERHAPMGISESDLQTIRATLAPAIPRTVEVERSGDAPYVVVSGWMGGNEWTISRQDGAFFVTRREGQPTEGLVSAAEAAGVVLSGLLTDTTPPRDFETEDQDDRDAAFGAAMDALCGIKRRTTQH